MGKESAFVGIGSSVSFWHSSEAVYCYSCIYNLEKESCNKLLNIHSLLSFFGIDSNRIKATRAKEIIDLQDEDLDSVSDKYFYAKEVYLDCLTQSEDELTKRLIEEAKKAADPIKIAALVDAIEAKRRLSGPNVPERLFKIVFLCHKYDKSELHNRLLLLNDSCSDLKLSTFFNNKVFKNLLFVLNLSTFRDLAESNIDLIYSLFADEFFYLVELIKSFDTNQYEGFEKETDKLLAKTQDKNPRGLEIFKGRNGIGLQKSLTLEEIGKKYSLTRERVRQIEAKTNDFISKNSSSIERTISLILVQNIKRDGYVGKNDLASQFSNPIYADYFCAFINLFYNNDFEYDEELQCLIKKGDSANIQEELVAEYPVMITSDQFNHFDSTKKEMAKKLYNWKPTNVYIRKGISFSEIVLAVFDELYPNGGHCDDDTCKAIMNYMSEKYDIYFDLSQRILQSYLQRNNYCFVDLGTFINRKYALSIDEDLLHKVQEYILQQDDIVQYAQIFKVFENNFLEFGITNWHYVKGVIDPLLSPSISTHKAYCCKSTINGTLSTHFDVLFKKHNGLLTLEEFKRSNPGVKDHVLYNYAANNYNKILMLSNKTFLHTDYCFIPKAAKEMMRTEISELFMEMNTSVLTDSKIYVSVKRSCPQLLENMPFIKNSFDFYSLTRYLLGDMFFFSRPFVSKDSKDLSWASVMRNYLIKLNRFDIHVVQSYCSRMHLRLYSYLNVLINMSDEFIQISRDVCVNKKMFVITESELSEIKYCLDYYLNSFGKMDLRQFSGYSAFPKLKYLWNQYLLVGIITTFFGDSYEIEYTDNHYDLTNYVIRRR